MTLTISTAQQLDKLKLVEQLGGHNILSGIFFFNNI